MKTHVQMFYADSRHRLALQVQEYLDARPTYRTVSVTWVSSGKPSQEAGFQMYPLSVMLIAEEKIMPHVEPVK